MKARLEPIKQWAVLQKYRFDLGISFMTVLNLVLLVIAAGDKIKTLLHIETRWLVAILVPLAIVGMWVFGYVLDRYFEIGRRYTKEHNDRNESINEILRILRDR